MFGLWLTLHEAGSGGFTTKSKFAREMADLVAIASSEGFITTRLDLERWGNRWFLTEDGFEAFKEIEDAIQLPIDLTPENNPAD